MRYTGIMNDLRREYRDYVPEPGDVIVFDNARTVIMGRGHYDATVVPVVRGAVGLDASEFRRSNGPFVLVEARHRPRSNSWIAVVAVPGGALGTIEWIVTTNISLHRCNSLTREVD